MQKGCRSIELPLRYPDRSCSRRMAACLLAALALHLLALSRIRLPVQPLAGIPSMLSVRLPSRTVADPATTGAMRAIGSGPPAPAPRSRPPGSPAASVTTEQTVGTATPNVATGSPPATSPAAAQLIESARRLVRQYTREAVPGEKPLVSPLADRPAMPALERALRTRAAGDTVLANGTIRVRTAAGTTYCLQPPPDILRNGPFEPMAVPSTCP